MAPCGEIGLIKTTFFAVTGISVAVNQIYSYLYYGCTWGLRRVRVLGESPQGVESGFQAAASLAGGSHEAGSETISYDLSWFWPVECEDIQVGHLPRCGGWGEENRKRRKGYTVHIVRR